MEASLGRRQNGPEDPTRLSDTAQRPSENGVLDNDDRPRPRWSPSGISLRSSPLAKSWFCNFERAASSNNSQTVPCLIGAVPQTKRQTTDICFASSPASAMRAQNRNIQNSEVRRNGHRSNSQTPFFSSAIPIETVMCIT